MSSSTGLERATADAEEAAGAIGARTNSKVGRRFVTGHGEYVDDITAPALRHIRFVRSPHGHARILDIDTSEAEAMPGVDLVWTAADIEPYVTRFGHPSLDKPDEEALASERVRYVGDEVALVLAHDRRTAIEAAEKVRVEYEKLDAVVDAGDALEPDAPVIHPALSEDPDCEVEGNLMHRRQLVAGDAEAALAEADVVVEGTFDTHKTNPSPLEPHGCVAEFNPADGTLTMWSSNQVPHLLREYLADTVNDLEVEDIVCKMPDIGGGFGVKLELFTHEVCSAVLSMVTGHPVKCVLDRLEELQAGRGRHPETFDARLGLTAEGEMLVFDADLVQNTGAYGSFGKTVAFSAMATGSGPYLIPNQRIDGRVVYTNVMPGSAVRGYGDPQFTFVREQLVDLAAEELGMDPIELRLRNVPRQEEMPMRTATGLKWRNADMPACLDNVREQVDWDGIRGGVRTADGKLRGVGVGTIMKRAGNKSAKGADFSSAIVKLDKHGQITVFSGITSIGQGTETGIAQIVADVLGADVERVTPVVGDSDVTPDDMGVWADRGTVMGGTAAARAADDLKATIRQFAAHHLGIEASAVAFGNDRVYESGAPENGLSLEEVAHEATFGDPEDRPAALKDGISLVGSAKFETQEAEFIDDETGRGNIAHGYTFGALVAVVDVDPRTGTVELADVAITEDLGNVINPKLVEGQIQGGIAHGLGEILLEEMVYDKRGNLENGTLIDYHLPTIQDVPMIRKMEKYENPDPSTSHGQKGVGECSTVPMAAAVANAFADATGIRFYDSPLTPDRVLPALVEHGLREL